MKRNEDSLRDLWHNIRIIDVPEEEKEKGSEKIFEEIIVEKFPNMRKEIATPGPGNAESPIQDKPQKKYQDTY